MRTYPVYPESVGTTTGTSLTTLVDQLLLELEPLAQQSKSILVNEIEPAFFTAASGMAIAEVIRENFAVHASMCPAGENPCIR